MLIDTHCHINDEKLFAKADQIVNNAITAGVKMMFVAGYDIPSSLKAIELAARFECVYAIVGLHPTEISPDYEQKILVIERMLSNKKVIAVGEIGLDYYWIKDVKQRELQKEAFIKQIQLANRHHLPIVVHMREAIEDTLELIKNNKPHNRGVMHSFSGNINQAQQFINEGLYISLSGPVTFKNAKEAHEVAQKIELQHLLIETDSPYLTPHPYRGKQNEPAHLIYVAQKISELKNVPIEEINAATTANASKLFHVKTI